MSYGEFNKKNLCLHGLDGLGQLFMAGFAPLWTLGGLVGAAGSFWLRRCSWWRLAAWLFRLPCVFDLMNALHDLPPINPPTSTDYPIIHGQRQAIARKYRLAI
ncbi:hypothetical protein HUJ05_008757 [Dendroctonus ponderosae]|nr:hypothetical protein HUJ05_008757 [Dendroctonus ponderosae]